MTSLEDLPPDVILAIATTRRTVAALARTNRRLYNSLNPLLYKLDCSRPNPTKSCILWGARKGSLRTVILGHQNGGHVNLDANDAEWPESGAVKAWHKDKWHYITEYGTALQLALRYGHQDIVAYLLHHGADVHAPSLACCHCRDLGRLSFPLHEVVCDVPVGSAIRVCRDAERDKTAALMLIRQGAHLHAPGRPLLHVLVETGRLDLILALLGQHGVDAGAVGFMRKTPLHVAAECGRTVIAKLLLDRPEVDGEALDVTRQTAAERAAEHGHIDTLALLLSKAQTNVLVDPTPTITLNTRVRALHAAAAFGQLDAVRLLVNQYNVCPSERDVHGNTAAHLAGQGGNTHVVSYLVGRPGFDANAVGCSGMTAVHYAARDTPQESASALIQALVGAGADVNVSASNTLTPLWYAVEKRRTDIALQLLSKGADPGVCGPDAQTGLTLLHRCMMPDRWPLSKDELNLIKELIGKGADPKASPTSLAAKQPAHTDGPPLFFAAAYVKSDQCVRWLLEAGASPAFPLLNMRALTANNPQSLLMAVFYYQFGNNHYGRASLSTRIYLRDVRPVMTRITLLLKHGARIDSVASEQSALQYACEVAMEECFELLCVMLRGATRRNISAEHLESLKVQYDGSGDSNRILSQGSRKIQRRARVYRQLSDFANTAFKQRTVALRKGKAMRVTRETKADHNGQ